MSALDELAVVLGDPAGRRFAAEFVVVAIAIAAITTVATDAVGTALPGLFPGGADGYSRFEFPNTRLEGVHALVGTFLLGCYLWWRLFFTELGDAVRELAENELV